MNEEDKIRIIPLGGLGEVGKNMMVFEYGGDSIIIDAGVMFLEDQKHGIDLSIPDFSYVLERKERVRAIILTHGHEDHIGALPYLLKEINVPIYGTKLTLGFAKNRLEEHSLANTPRFVEVIPRQNVSIGTCMVEFFRVCHSIPDGVGLALHTPHGIIIHSGDFKIDFSPMLGELFDLNKLAELGEKGVLLLMSDSTNAEREGYTLSEHRLNRMLTEAITQASGRVIISTFASNVYRIQQIFNICERIGRKIVLFGMSMEKHIAMARNLGYLQFNDRNVIPSAHVKNHPGERLCILTTGSQGEPMSALARFVNKNYKTIEIQKGDTVVLSASIIPGHETMIWRIVNEIFRKGASVYYEGFEDLHVSGHASQEELKLLIAVTRPRYFLPIHGEFRHLIHHSNLCHQVGVREENILIAEDGDVITIDDKGISITETVGAGQVYVDSRGLEDIQYSILKEKQKIARDGLVVLVLTVSGKGNGFFYPEVVTKGFAYSGDLEDLVERVKTVAFEIAVRSRQSEIGDLEILLRDRMIRFFRKETGVVPLIVPVVIKVG